MKRRDCDRIQTRSGVCFTFRPVGRHKQLGSSNHWHPLAAVAHLHMVFGGSAGASIGDTDNGVSAGVSSDPAYLGLERVGRTGRLASCRQCKHYLHRLGAGGKLRLHTLSIALRGSRRHVVSRSRAMLKDHNNQSAVSHLAHFAASRTNGCPSL